MTLRFGTDGVRGIANAELTPEFTVALARAAARVLGGSRVLIGRDTRRSGTLLTAALAAGFTAEGMDVVDLGVLPTPGVAQASVRDNVLAAMVSASHNPFPDNGIKFFQPGGRKLDDALEARIEEELDRLLVHGVGPAEASAAPTGALVGELSTDATATSHYEDGLLEVLEGRRLDGLKVVLDCANGAAFLAGPEAFTRLGATVTVLHAEPTGVNINANCGSTYPQSLQGAVVAQRADLGFAFDGDADRMLAVDHNGELVDGDQLMAMMALDLRDRGLLAKDTVVVTVMTNLGFKIAMAAHGVNVAETKVGDRYVLEEIEANGYSLGGEQSGHLILRDHVTTGDGILSGLVIADLVKRSGRSLAGLASVMSRLPQILRNVKGVDRARLNDCTALWTQVREIEGRFNGSGRVLIRPSGTESLVRVMVEAPTQQAADDACAELCATVERELRIG